MAEEGKGVALTILGIVAVIAVVGLVLLFRGGGTGRAVGDGTFSVICIDCTTQSFDSNTLQSVQNGRRIVSVPVTEPFGGSQDTVIGFAVVFLPGNGETIVCQTAAAPGVPHHRVHGHLSTPGSTEPVLGGGICQTITH